MNSAITFDTEPFSAEGRKIWLSQLTPGSVRQCLVAKRQGEILGYASSPKLRPKPAYNSSVETNIYLLLDALGQGLILYGRLLDNLMELGVHRCYGIVALPNEPSIRLPRRFGFSQVGVLNEIGFKFGRYHDTAWLERRLSPSLPQTGQD